MPTNSIRQQKASVDLHARWQRARDSADRAHLLSITLHNSYDSRREGHKSYSRTVILRTYFEHLRFVLPHRVSKKHWIHYWRRE
jgi:hypothetical protein